MKLMTMKQYMKMSKPALIRKITQTLRVMPKTKLARLCYEITKAKLRRFAKIERDITGKNLVYTPPRLRRMPKRKTKRKFSKKQLAAQRLFAKRARAGTLKRRRR